MFIDLLDQFNVNQAPDQNSASLINLYMEEEQTTRLQQYPFSAYKDPPKGEYKTALYSTPGLTLFCNTGHSPVRQLLEQNETPWCVAGNQFGSVSSLGVFTSWGTLNTSSGPVQLQAITGGIDTNNQIIISDGTNGYTFNIGTEAFAEIPTYIAGVQSISVADGGSGYVTAPTVTITDSTGTGATAVSVISSGVITEINVTAPGSNYTAPTISFSGSGGAVADAIVGSNSFPQTTQSMCTLDDYVFAAGYNSITYNMCNLSDTTTWDALNFASKYRKPDKIGCLITVNGEVWVMGTKTVEIWDNVGNPNFPLQRRPDIFIEHGISSPYSPSIVASTVMYHGKAKSGGYAIMQINAYIPRPVSTKPIMYLMNSFSTVSDAFAYTYALNGHEFYESTFPTGNTTISFDASNETWFLRQSYINGAYGRFLGSSACFCYGKNLIGDNYSGNIYYQDPTNGTENGVPIRRQFVTPHIYQGGRTVTVNYLQIDCQTNVGSGATFLLEKSTDHAQTWETVGTYTIPTSGANLIRVPALGEGIVFTFRITTTGNFPFSLMGFQGDITIGEW